VCAKGQSNIEVGKVLRRSDESVDVRMWRLASCRNHRVPGREIGTCVVADRDVLLTANSGLRSREPVYPS
jgi:hypothetical protein